MADVKFSDIDDTFKVMTDKDFENETGIKFNDIENTFSLDNIADSINVDSSKELKRNGIGVLELPKIQTSNTFINKASAKVRIEKEKEKAELANIDLEYPFKRIPIMTDSEKQLYHFMMYNLCQLDRIVILSKVRLADIIDVDERVVKKDKLLYKICYKHVDFVICDKDTLDVICVVELDDYTHENKQAKDRDLFVMQALDAANIPVVRIRIKIKTLERRDLYYIDDLINRKYAPKCPKCGRQMYAKSARDGHRFYACEDFIRCRHTQNIDLRGEQLP